MTPRSAAERGPRTAAGRALLEIAGTEGQPTGVIRDAILAIEAEATTAAPTAADAWQAGYEACWNRLKDAGRLLPSSPSEREDDFERPETLALLLLIAACVVPMAEKVSPDAGARRSQLERAVAKIGPHFEDDTRAISAAARAALPAEGTE